MRKVKHVLDGNIYKITQDVTPKLGKDAKYSKTCEVSTLDGVFHFIFYCNNLELVKEDRKLINILQCT
jgi:hypothetical protein